ncbi:MAG: nodulation protein NfeD [Rhodospirillaceae bacterium]
MLHAMARYGRLVLAGLIMAVGVVAMAQTEPPARVVVRLDVDGVIGPASSEYIANGLATAAAQDAALVVLRMDTPGGLDTAMRDIIRDILASPIPVATYIAPGGARAASAGTYILYASHIAAMAPATNLGAATPVQIGGLPLPGSPQPQPQPQPESQPQLESQPQSKNPVSAPKEGTGLTSEAQDSEAQDPAESRDQTVSPPPPKDALGAKMVNDAAAYIRGLADLRARNADWAEKAVRQAASLSSQAALEQKVIDVVADTLPDLLQQIDGRVVKTSQGDLTLDVAGAEIEPIEPNWRTRLLSVITQPNIAFILMLVGTYGLIFELSNPGAIIPGTIGAISILLGLYALNVLPVNYAGLGLVLLGMALIIAEAFAPSFGVLGIGGVASFIVGAAFLFETDAPGFALSWTVIIGTALFTATFLIVVMYLAISAYRRKVVTGREEIIGATAEVTEWEETAGRVHFHGETWHAEGPAGLAAGTPVEIKDRRGLVLVVDAPSH